MQQLEGDIVVSPTDLTKALACRHLSWLDLEVAKGQRERPEQQDEALEVLFARGIEHEEAYRDKLIAQGLTVVEVAGDRHGRADLQAAEAETLALMEQGVDVIYQGTFFDGTWRGHADFLLKRADRPGTWGWSYDVADTKLARRLKVPALLQMAAYAERLTELQGIAPEQLIVVTGDKEKRPYRFADCASYARRVRQQLLDFVATPVPVVPEPVPHCDQCRWVKTCHGQWRAQDHLSFVAFMRNDHRRSLEAAGVTTMKALGASDPGLLAGTCIAVASLQRLVAQARLQVQERETGKPVYELLPAETGRGFALLPEPSEGDVFFDIEGDPFVGEQGLEYLWGIWHRGTFTPHWGLEPAAEQAAFEACVDQIMAAWAADPDMHVYHYAPYEPARLTSLAARYGSRQAEIDRLLRGQRLVDLYAVVRQGLRISKESYSIKKLEAFYWPAREGGVADALGSVVAFERWLVDGDQALLDDIAHYNKDDCESTQALRDWLEERRVEGGGDVEYGDRPVHTDGSASEAVAVEQEELGQLREALLATLPVDEPQRAAQMLVADLLEWHRRESLPEWWEYYHRREMTDEELVDDPASVGLLSEFKDVGQLKLSTLWEATFPPQDTKLGPGEERYVDPRDDSTVGVVHSISPEEGRIVVKRRTGREAPDAPSLVPGAPLDTRNQRRRLAEFARDLLAHGWSPSRSAGRAARDLILREPPRVLSGVLRYDDESASEAVVRASTGLDASVLAVQGPPGTGKTWSGAKMIVSLLEQGSKVGVCGFSHKVIGNLLDAVAVEAARQGVVLKALQKASEEDRCASSIVRATDSPADIALALTAGSATLVGGTAWLYSRDDMQRALDVLVIDEAGQMSLANVLAIAGSATNLVLLGDPQQLAQPVRGEHPEGAEVSALEHYLDGHAVIPGDRGLFLDETYRMHPDVARFVSGVSYDGELGVAAGCEKQRVLSASVLGGTGLRWVPVEHRDNSSASSEEAEVVAGLVSALLADGRWVDAEGVERPLAADDVLVLSPYNAHVHRLRHRLEAWPGVRIGTVDKYQGQEAPVVIYSMASSSVADAPRGVDFLYSLNRFNVAVSRARGVVAVVCSPELLTPVVNKPDQLRLVNALCRFVEEAS